ncbi:MAG: hypothetical protein KIT54_11070 [Phycisphaeraceae bacterium]|nr:hypothetical protein [Phycisphaeraceae bacterium]
MALQFVPRRVLVLVLMALASVGLTASSVAMAPEPNPIPVRWQLDLDVGPLRVASVDTPGLGPMLYFYLTYTVTNNTDEDILLAPSFDLSTETGINVVAGQGVPASVTREILGRLNNPLLNDQVNMIGVLRRGVAHAREGLVVWPVRDVTADEVRVYMAGFSGETARIQVIDRQSGNPRDVVLRKTLMAIHRTPGNIDGVGSQPLGRAEARWIMR